MPYFPPEIWRSIFSFDNTYCQDYKKCLVEILKKRWKHSLCFRDETDEIINYTIQPCVKTPRGKCNCWAQGGKNCQGSLEFNIDFSPFQKSIFLTKGGINTTHHQYELFNLISYTGDSPDRNIVAIDLNEMDFSMRKLGFLFD